MSDSLDLWDYRRRVHDMYRRVRAGEPGEPSWSAWRRDRDELFATHPQSPFDDPSEFATIPYFPYDPRFRCLGDFTPIEEESSLLSHSGLGQTRFIKIGSVAFDLFGSTTSLTVLWLDAYGGGIFVPFRDLTNGSTTYGGGRYLLDTVKGADLGHEGHRVVLDFNYAYHPSCVHSPRWSCPLSPPENRLDVAITAGERLGTADH